MRAAWAVMLLSMASCGYQPPAQTDVGAPSYQADLAACQSSARSGVEKENAKRALTWFASPVRRWGQIGDATQACMGSKGYGRVRWCTADELTHGTRSGGLVVTSSGVQCTDPPGAERRKPAT